MHPSPPSSTYLQSAHFILHPALCKTLNVTRTKILHLIGKFPKFRLMKLKLFILSENWHIWYIGGTDSKSRLRFLKFWSQNPVLGKYGLKKSKLSLSLGNWHKWYLENADPYSKISFLDFPTQSLFLGKFGPKKSE